MSFNYIVIAYKNGQCVTCSGYVNYDEAKRAYEWHVKLGCDVEMRGN